MFGKRASRPTVAEVRSRCQPPDLVGVWSQECSVKSVGFLLQCVQNTTHAHDAARGDNTNDFFWTRNVIIVVAHLFVVIITADMQRHTSTHTLQAQNLVQQCCWTHDVDDGFNQRQIFVRAILFVISSTHCRLERSVVRKGFGKTQAST